MLPISSTVPAALAIKQTSYIEVLLKKGIWVYILLLIFEGAFRKWVFPGLAAPLLVIRDPVALFLIFTAWRYEILPSSLWLSGLVFICMISFFTTLFLGHGNWMIALYGARVFLLHFPLIFIIARVFDIHDVEKAAWVMSVMAIPMTIILGLQFYSAQSAWINRGVGGDISGSGFSGAMGYFRPSGTFSFTTGVSQFYGLVGTFIFYFWFKGGRVNRFILSISTICLLIAIPLSISRLLFFQIIVSILFLVMAIVGNRRYLWNIIIAALGIVVTLFILSQFDFFRTAIDAFSMRLDHSGKHEGGLRGTLVERYLKHLVNAIYPTTDVPLFGYGIGMGTNVASMLLTGDRSFMIAEEEWPRLIGEMGPVLGLGAIFIRLGLCVKLSIISFKQLFAGNLLPWIVLSFCLLNVPQGQWAQPTALGFSIIAAGFCIASINRED